MNLMNEQIEYENLHKLNEEFEPLFREKFNLFLRKGWYILGEEVSAFEKAFAAYCGAPYALGVANGLNALEMGLAVLGLPPRSEVIVPSNTYIATILSIINTGHVPVLVEPDIHTCNIDPARIEEAITENTKVIMVVHLYGQACAMDKIMDIAGRHRLEVIEDCAQAHGAAFGGQQVGTFGRIGAYSFYPTKNLGALGDAGGIITSDQQLYEKLKALRNYGSEKKYHNKYTGYNSRLDELQAAFLNVKLPFLDKINAHKKQLAAIYHAGLCEAVVKPFTAAGADHVYHIYNIRTEKRDALKACLLSKGIHTEIHYPVAPHRQEAYQSYFQGQSFPLSEAIHASTLSLPISYSTSTAAVEKVVETVNAFFSN